MASDLLVKGYSLSAENSGGSEGDYPFIQAFVSGAEDARAQLPHWLAALQTDGVFWVTYPKHSSGIKTDVNRDQLAALVQEETSFRVVSNVSIDAIWSALRLRQKD